MIKPSTETKMGGSNLWKWVPAGNGHLLLQNLWYLITLFYVDNVDFVIGPSVASAITQLISISCCNLIQFQTKRNSIAPAP